VLDAKFAEELVRFFSMKLVAGGELDIELLLEGGDHVVTLPRTLEVEFENLGVGPLALGVEKNLGAATGKVLDQTLDHALGDVHQVLHISVGHIEFANCEFRVVGKINALVTEHASDFVDAVKSTNDEFLEVKFGGDAKVKVEIEVVVVGNEWLGGSTSSKHRHHGRLNFHKTQVVEITANIVNDLATLDEQLAGVVIEDEVKVTLAVTRFLILETKVTRRKLVEVGREELNLARVDAEFALLGAGRSADDTDDITTLEVRVVSDEGVGVFSVSVEELMVFTRQDACRLTGEKP